jgi:hypothetical protein
LIPWKEKKERYRRTRRWRRSKKVDLGIRRWKLETKSQKEESGWRE